jgi:hypothetical protein
MLYWSYLTMTMTPNKSPEPTPITPSVCREGFGLADVIRSAWLSFFR